MSISTQTISGWSAELKTQHEHTNGIPMRHLQIVNTARYARDFEINEAAAVYAALVVHYAIQLFAAKVTTPQKLFCRATCIPMLAMEIAKVNDEDKKYGFSKALRVAEDVYQRLRKLVTNNTSIDFNMMTTDDCGNPYTFVTKLDQFTKMFSLKPEAVLSVNRTLKSMDDAIKNKNPSNVQFIAECLTADEIIKNGPLKAPTCTEINNIRRMQYFEDLYCRWRNTMFNCKNLHPVDTSTLDTNTLMALYYNSLDHNLRDNKLCAKPTQVCGRSF